MGRNGQLRIKNVFHVKNQKDFLNDNIVNMEENQSWSNTVTSPTV